MSERMDMEMNWWLCKSSSKTLDHLPPFGFASSGSWFWARALLFCAGPFSKLALGVGEIPGQGLPWLPPALSHMCPSLREGVLLVADTQNLSAGAASSTELGPPSIQQWCSWPVALHPISVVTAPVSPTFLKSVLLTQPWAGQPFMWHVKRWCAKHLQNKVGRARLNKEVKKIKDSDNREMYLKEVLTKDTTLLQRLVREETQNEPEVTELETLQKWGS